MDIDQAKMARDKLGWWAVALLLFALAGGMFYLLTLLLTFPGAFLAVIVASTVLSTAALVVYKRYIEKACVDEVV